MACGQLLAEREVRAPLPINSITSEALSEKRVTATNLGSHDKGGGGISTFPAYVAVFVEESEQS
jgi:hypothetical protein